MPLLTSQRTRIVQDATQRDIPQGPTPATRRRLYELMRDGETLVSIVREHHTLLYDPDYRYRVEHRPARSWGFYWPEPGDPTYGEDETPGWLEGLRRDGVAAVILYAGSPEDRALAAPGSGYRLVYEQPPEDGVVIRIYRRAESAGVNTAGGPGG